MDIEVNSDIHDEQMQVMTKDENEELNGSGVVVKIRHAIHPALPQFLFKVYGVEQDGTYAANKIFVYLSGNEDGKVQEIHFIETQTPDKENLGVVIEDMNFDGYQDIRIQQSMPASPNIPYYYWLWDEDSTRFVPNTSLEIITSPEFDQKNKWIKSDVRGNAATYYEDIYKYIDEIPMLVKETEEMIDEVNNVVHITVMEFSNNEMKITEQYDKPLSD
ncbi:hypothetical protein D3C76_1108930 [compost metagenome]